MALKQQFSNIFFLAILLILFSCNNHKSTEKVKEVKDSSAKQEINAKKSSENKFLKEKYKFSTYHNARFDFCVNYPSALLFPQGESDNGDGQVLLSKDLKFSLAVSGMFNAEGLTVNGLYQQEYSFYSTNNSYHLTFYQQEKNYYVFSGLKGSKFFYVKTFLVKDKIFSIYAEFPQENNEIYSALLNEVLKTFPAC